MPVQEEEYCVFPKSKYQSDGWEPFLPPHPLSDTVFEHLALEFQARKRALDQVRRNQTTGPEDEFFVCNNHDAKSRNSLAIDLSQIHSMDDFADRLILIDEEFNQYLSSPRYQPSLEQIKRFLYIEAKRLPCTFPGWDASGNNFASIQNVSVIGGQDTKDDEEEEDKYRQCLLRLSDLHLLPKVVELRCTCRDLAPQLGSLSSAQRPTPKHSPCSSPAFATASPISESPSRRSAL